VIVLKKNGGSSILNTSGDIGRVDPDFNTIIEKCIEQLKIKYPNYGNTWLYQDDAYYKERLLKEYMNILIV